MRRVLSSIVLLAMVSMLGLGGAARAAAPAANASGPDADSSMPFNPGDPPQIVGGAPNTVTNFPWMAALLLTDEPDPFLAQFCGGTLIDPRYILTAAHCITNFDSFSASDVQVALGKTDLDTITAGDRIDVASITYPPGWSGATEVQHIAVNATGGTFTVTWNGQTTAALAFNISAAAFTTAMENLSNVAPGDVVVTGGPGNAGGTTPYVLTWAAAVGNVPQPTTTATNLTGGASTATPSTVVPPRDHDLALLQLATPATGVPTAAFATDTSNEALNTPAIILGWGAIDTGATQFSPVLHGGGVKVLAAPSTTTCGTYTPGTIFFNTSQICAGVSQSGGTPDNCVFDDGGPLAVGNPGGWKIIGVTTDIGPCGSGNPSLYARVSADTGWINTVLGPDPGSVGTYHAIPPLRVVDTRTNTGLLASGYVGPQWIINPQIAGWPGTTVPVTGAVAAVVNVTVTAPNRNGNLTVFPTGSAVPLASNLNFVAGQTVANLVTVKLGQAGKISIANTAGSIAATSTHIIVDLVGWYSAAETGALFHSMAPNRIVDTRFGTTANPSLNTAVSNSTPVTAKVCDTPTGVGASASGVVLNATVKSGFTSGHLTIWPSGSAPVVSNLNYTAGQTIANLVIVKVGPSCTVKVGNSPGATGRAPINVILDVVGWFGAENTADGGAHFHAMVPRRTVDTRFGTVDNARSTALGPQEVYEPLARDIGPIPVTAVAVIMNLTATQPSKSGYLTLFPDGSVTPPTASNLNFLAGQNVPNLAIVQIDTDDTVAVANSFGNAAAGTVHVIMDIVGWFE